MSEIARLGFAIPTYRRPALLSRAIESIISQARELGAPLYVPDNSCDGTNVEVIEKWKAVYRNIIHEVNERNIGIDRNVHRAIVRCPAQYVHVIGDDDLILPGFTQRVMKLLSARSPGHIITSYLYLLNDYTPTSGKPIIPRYDDTTSLRQFLPNHAWTLGFIGAHVFNRYRFSVGEGEGFGSYFHHIVRMLGYLDPDEEIAFVEAPLVGNRVDDETTPTWTADRLNVVFGLEKAFAAGMTGKYPPAVIEQTVACARDNLGYTQFFRLLYWAAVAERSGDGPQYWDALASLVPDEVFRRIRFFPRMLYRPLMLSVPSVRRIKRLLRRLKLGRT